MMVEYLGTKTEFVVETGNDNVGWTHWSTHDNTGTAAASENRANEMIRKARDLREHGIKTRVVRVMTKREVL